MNGVQYRAMGFDSGAGLIELKREIAAIRANKGLSDSPGIGEPTLLTIRRTDRAHQPFAFYSDEARVGMSRFLSAQLTFVWV
jgi:hypothetical protein